MGKLGREGRIDGVRGTGAKSTFLFSPQFSLGQSAPNALRSHDQEHLLLKLVTNRKFTFKILSPVLRIPSWPAGPFSEIFEIKIPCKRQQKTLHSKLLTPKRYLLKRNGLHYQPPFRKVARASRLDSRDRRKSSLKLERRVVSLSAL